jgi:hypothetical protein
MKEVSKGRHFDGIDDIRSKTTAALKAIPQKNSVVLSPLANYTDRAIAAGQRS